MSENIANMLTYLARQRRLSIIKSLIRSAKRWLIRILATDERAELSSMRKAGLLKLDTADSALLRRPLALKELYDVNDSALDSSRWFFYQLDAPLRRPDITAYGLAHIPYWDRILTNLERPVELHWLVKLLRSRANRGEGTCLDVGCGRRFPGPYLLAEHYDKVTAIDLDPGIMENKRRANLEFEVADAARLPYTDASFDDVYSISVIEHFKLGTAFDAFREIHRVLKPGGRFVATLGIGEERKSWPGKYHPDDVYGCRDVLFWVGLLKNLGFGIQLDPHGQGQYNDRIRLFRVCMDGARGRARQFATYRFVATKPSE